MYALDVNRDQKLKVAMNEKQTEDAHSHTERRRCLVQYLEVRPAVAWVLKKSSDRYGGRNLKDRRWIQPITSNYSGSGRTMTHLSLSFRLGAWKVNCECHSPCCVFEKSIIPKICYREDVDIMGPQRKVQRVQRPCISRISSFPVTGATKR